MSQKKSRGRTGPTGSGMGREGPPALPKQAERLVELCEYPLDFTDFLGLWQPDAAFDEVIANQRQIDTEKWH